MQNQNQTKLDLAQVHGDPQKRLKRLKKPKQPRQELKRLVSVSWENYRKLKNVINGLKQTSKINRQRNNNKKRWHKPCYPSLDFNVTNHNKGKRYATNRLLFGRQRKGPKPEIRN
jgi:hypothetical protein